MHAIGKVPARKTIRAAFLLLLLVHTAGAGEPAVVRLWNYNIHDKKYQQKMYKLFNERHPDIKIEYTSISGTMYDSTLQAVFVAKEPPDLFLPSGGLISFHYLRTRGLIMALNDAAPNDAELKEWMARFPPEQRKFVEGVSMFDGKVYVVDLTGEQLLPGAPLFYNTKLFREAGLEKPPATQSEIREMAAKITEAGQGKYFGAVRGGRMQAMWHYDLIISLAHAAGARGTAWGWPSYADFTDGKYHHTSPEFLSALTVWINMRKDDSVHPGETTMEDEQAKMAFATDKAAMQFGYTWNPGNYLTYNADVEFDLVLAPTRDDGIRRGFYMILPDNKGGATGGYMVSAFTKNPKAVWEVIKFMSSLEFQEGWVKGGYGISYLREANKPENFSVRQMYKFVKWGTDPSYRVIWPPLSEGAKKLFNEGYVPGVYPTPYDVFDTVYYGKAGVSALGDLDKRLNAALEAGIKRAQDAGVAVTREDFIFPDWDSTTDYKPKKK